MTHLLLLCVLAQQPRLVSEDEHVRLVAAIPRTDDPRMEEIRTDPRLIVYTDKEVPPVFQAANNGQLGVFKAGTFFSVGGVNVGQGSNQIPWKSPAGLDDATDWTSFGFMWLPPGTKIVVERGRLPDDVQGAQFFLWRYPVGTVLGEVFRHTGDVSRPSFEMRIRHKVAGIVPGRIDASWTPQVFRPFASREELDQAVAFSGSPDAEKFLATSERGEWKFNFGTAKVSPLLRRSAIKDILPSLDRATVKRLLEGEFSSVRDREWVEGGFAPDTRGNFHIVPRGYNGAMLPVSQAACASCHRTAGQNVRPFGFSSPAGWDEWVRGNAGDESFRFHPFDPASASSNNSFRRVRLNQKMLDAGILEVKGVLP